MASDLEVTKGRRDFSYQNISSYVPLAPVSERMRSVFPESFGEGSSDVLIGTRLPYIPLDKRMCFELKCVYVLQVGSSAKLGILF